MSSPFSISTNCLRAFLPARNFTLEKQFYLELEFSLSYDDGELAVFEIGTQSFYLQKYYQQTWAENCMMFFEVEDVDQWYNFLEDLHLDKRYSGIRYAAPANELRGRVCRLVTPTGLLCHLARFNKWSTR